MKPLSKRSLLIAVIILTSAGCGHFKSKKLGAFDRRDAQSRLQTTTSNPSKPTAEDKQELKIAMARSLEQRGEIQQAKAIYTDLAKDDQPCIQAIHRLAVINEKEGQTEIAKKYFEQALLAQPDNPELICDFGYSHYLHGDLESAERDLRRAIAIDPQLRRAHNTLGMLLARRGLETEAVVSFRRGGCNPTSAQLNLAFAQSVEGKLEVAEETYRTVQRTDPSSEEAHRGLVSIQHIADRLAAAPRKQNDASFHETTETEVKDEATPVRRTAFASDLELVSHQEIASEPDAHGDHGIRDFGFLE